ncbi:BV-e31 [Clostera anachoreta granulovirus]|uniref:BV-e31 n=1 Tax=Clostera anachoreta granulovirus TaxID=283675 RepID=F4ZKT3_9BBAC|nr:BV-e31 [Clostera anachoreta granulovirus]AEB00344.1 BV-e31 [Clostera anachoreta granulovirus]
MVRRGRHAGLLLITEDDSAIILQANKSYNDSVNKNLRYNRHIPFVEKLSIPRGRHDVGERDYETAVREFIEETGLVFDRICVCSEPFVLEWQDDAKVYRYVMYVAFLIGTLYYLKKRPNSYVVRLKERVVDKNVYEYEVDMLRQRFNSQELVRRAEVMSLKKYVTYMESRQLCTYKYSNYNFFFEYVFYVKALYKSGRLDKWFEMDLQWCVDAEKYRMVCY